MNRFAALCTWLEALVVASALAGAALVFLPSTSVFHAYNATYARAFWDADALSPQALRQHAFTLGVAGLGVVGWVLTLWFVLRGPFRRREPWAFHAVWAPVMAWAVGDLLLAVHAAVWGEAIFAAAAGLGFAVPLFLARPFFGGDVKPPDV